MAEVFHSFASTLASTKDNGVLSLWCTECKLVECEAFAASLQDLSASAFGEFECAHSQLRAFQETNIIRNGRYNNGNLGLQDEGVLERSEK